ncbi:MAG: Hpt domain-containing protein, partial [Polyangiaceae bacterium]|nr:Hpt domain-containing protein [Polyangiaceae bacterium]
MDAPVDSSPGHPENKLGVLCTSERDEFLSEAQEIIDQLSRDLLLLDRTEIDCARHGTDKNHTYGNHTDKGGEADPNLINAVFRGVHTLKGLCGLFDESKL